MCWICTFSAGNMSLTICSSRNDICSIEPSPCPPLRVLISSQSWYHHNHDIIIYHYIITSCYHHNHDIITIHNHWQCIKDDHWSSPLATFITKKLFKCLLDRPGVGRRGLRNIYIYTHILYTIYYILYTILYTHKDLSSGTTFLEMKLLPQCVVNSFPVWLPPPFLIMYSPMY